MAFRNRGSKAPESAREEFLEALRSGLSQSAAATVAGVSHHTGWKWAKAAGIAADTKHRGTRYSAAAREAFWAAMHSGATVTQAAVSAGVSDQVARLMRSLGIEGVRRGKRVKTTKADPAAARHPDLVGRSSAPPGPTSCG